MTWVHVDRLRARRNHPGRRCGPCTACCTVMAVTELRKPSRRACDHVCADGCRVHADRPPSCREFHCLWLRGAVGEGETQRPDELGVLFDYFVTTETGEAALLAFELWAGALDAPTVRTLLSELALTREVTLSYRSGAWSTLTAPLDAARPTSLRPPRRSR